jgi:hypothetical protein
MKKTAVTHCRCPACNPMHGPSFMRHRARVNVGVPGKGRPMVQVAPSTNRRGLAIREAGEKVRHCDVCGDSKRVPVDVAARFVRTMNELETLP